MLYFFHAPNGTDTGSAVRQVTLALPPSAAAGSMYIWTRSRVFLDAVQFWVLDQDQGVCLPVASVPKTGTGVSKNPRKRSLRSRNWDGGHARRLQINSSDTRMGGLVPKQVKIACFDTDTGVLVSEQKG